ncbi:MAG: Retron-type reverse transcriptase [Candidatus Levybacteria bacterium GW2011_GWB1_35_5]|nr:MAG: Retron-type reverse transcriptase [Candidatus Levybacteria bacterium GW2011_GWB1_35_5]
MRTYFKQWDEFKKEKRNKKDVQQFERHLEDNLFELYRQLKRKTYRHGTYQEFYVTDPKRRHIHKSSVRDRVLHHLLYKYLYELFDKHFIYDSYSCRKDKGIHKAVKRLEKFARIVSKNYTENCWSLKCDIKKFFASVDHDILKNLIARKIRDEDINWLINNVIDSFSSEKGLGRGIPLGNLTSQIFANIYLNEFDQFVKHKLKIKYYLRYADDFLVLNTSTDPKWKEIYLESIKEFLESDLRLELHPKKIATRKLRWGIDFCGYIVLPHYILPRTKTKKRVISKISKGNISYQSLQSYLGYLSHANSFKLSEKLKNLYYLSYRIGLEQ